MFQVRTHSSRWAVGRAHCQFCTVHKAWGQCPFKETTYFHIYIFTSTDYNFIFHRYSAILIECGFFQTMSVSWWVPWEYIHTYIDIIKSTLTNINTLKRECHEILDNLVSYTWFLFYPQKSFGNLLVIRYPYKRMYKVWIFCHVRAVPTRIRIFLMSSTNLLKWKHAVLRW